MASVRHFMVDGDDKAACGARIFLCEDSTDDRRYVDCGRCRKTKGFINYDPTRYDVEVWNHKGDVIRWFRSVKANKVDEIRREYEDDPTATLVVIERAG
jgi:hypothetical protein